MKFKLLISVLLLLLMDRAIAQLNNAEYVFGSETMENASSAIQTRDGGFAIVGEQKNASSSDSMFVVKLDKSGNMQWSESYGKETIPTCIIQTSDGGYAITGKVFDFLGEDFVLKLDSAGRIKWMESVGGSSGAMGYSLVQSLDGGYVVAGSASYLGAGQVNIYVFKLDTAGNLMWNKTFGGTKQDYGYSITKSRDGGYVIAGTTTSYAVGDADAYIIKIDYAGNLKWTKTIGGMYDDNAFSIAQGADSGYVLAGYSNSFGNRSIHAYVVKIDNSGNIIWTRFIGGIGEQAFAITACRDKGYALTGMTTLVSITNADVYLVKLDSAGNVQWSRSIGGTQNDQGNSIVQCSDGGYAIAGNTSSYGLNGEKAYFIKTDSLGYSCHSVSVISSVDTGGVEGTGDIVGSGGNSYRDSLSFYPFVFKLDACDSILLGNKNVTSTESSISVYPNPSHGCINFVIDEASQKLGEMCIEIFNVFGECVKKQDMNSFNNSIYLMNVPNGLYFYKIKSKANTLLFGGKLAVEN